MITDQVPKPPCPSSLLDGCQSKVVAPRIPKLVREEKKKDAPLTPSAFLKEMSLTTEQRLACTREMRRPRIVQLLDMSETSHQKFSSVDLDQSLFQPFPSEVIFQNFIPCEPYQVPLILRNNDKIPRLVKVVLESSPYFKVISPNDVCNKVAPGMPSTFHVLFIPEENKDYFHELTCITEREKFIVPIRALGARGILDFPDQINFSTCPVKYNTQKTLLVRNIGNREARYQITTQRPFSAEPSIGTLGIRETAQFTIDFQPEKSGNHCQDLVVHYDTGEDVHVGLYGAAADVNLRLDKNSLTVEKTYITLANQRSVVIHNRSDIIAHFQWKACATPEEEEQKKQRLCQTLQTEKENVLDQLVMECHLDPSLREHLAIVTRTFQNRQATVQEDALLFNNNIFSIEPVEGDVWPNSTAEISVIFRPQEAGIYHHTVYCDISGRETRLPLRIKGEAMGPKLLFNIDQLDIGKIFVGSSHSYEVVLSNEGAIDGLFNLTWPATALGSSFAFRPSEGIIEPGNHQAIHATFSSTVLGHFCEEFKFNVNGSPQPVSLVIRGCVIGPTFHFDVPSLSFGDVSFGFPHSLSCCLSNTSLVPLTFNLRVPGDGTGEPSVTSRDQASDIFRPSWRRKAGLGGPKPKEFAISPSHGTIRPQGAMDIQVTLCSNTVKSYETALVVDVKGSGEDVLALPITARCLTPPLRLADPTLNFGHCFLRFPYQRMATLVNDTNLFGCYGLLPQKPTESPAILHSSPEPCGIVYPHSTVEIPLTLEVQQRGRQEVTALVAIFGDQDLPLKLQLVTFGEGPVVYVYPAELDFGSIPVLQDVPRVLSLANQSVIPAPFEAQMARPHSLWRIEPSSGIVPPQAEVSLLLIAHLNDTVLFQDKVHLAFEDSMSSIIPVQAAGIGTTIVTDKPFAPAIDLGPHFCLDPCFYRFRITNRGRRTHQLYWMTEGFRPFRLRAASLPAIGPSARGTGPSRQAKDDSPFPVFKLRPLRMELIPGQSLDMQLEGSSDTPKVIQERLICHAIIGKQSGKECIMTVDVSCQFIAPVLQISSKEITFRVEKNPRDVLEAQYKPLALKNVSPLPLSLFLSLQEPFCLCDTDHEKLTAPLQPLPMEVGETRHLCVRFDPLYKDDLYNRAAEEVLTIRYLEHPHIDHISLRGEVYFPNLQFQTLDLDFGCILNDTEMIRDVIMTNCSPLHVKYRWSFLTDEPGCLIRFSPRGVKPLAEEEADKEPEAPQPLPALPPTHSESGESMGEEAGEEAAPSATGEEVSLKEPAEPVAAEPSVSGQSLRQAIATECLTAAAEEAGKELPKKSPPEAKEVLWCVDSEEQHLTGVEEVFDIMPLFGTLLPKETQKMSFTFYGHADIVARVKALCEVEGGPTYEVFLSGEASLVSYAFDRKEIDYGLQLFNHISVAEIVLKNTGKVGFAYSVLDNVLVSAESPPPGVPLTLPVTSYIASGKEQVLKIYYLPGVPEVFQRTFRIQVAHLEPDRITLKGEGIFPRICLDLPRNFRGNERYSMLLREARQRMEQESQKDSVSNSEEAPTEEPMDAQLQMEVERLLIQEHALEQQRLLAGNDPSEDSIGINQKVRRKLVKAQLPEYILDFGYIILGTVRSHIVKITNTSPFPVSFYADTRNLQDSGFCTGLDRVKNLPFCETETFAVLFDPQSANRPLGEVEVVLPIKVISGPTFHVSFRATVIMPSLCMSNENLDFSAVQCGQCQVETIQLHNQLQVNCEWFAHSSEQMKKVDKHMPAALRRKLRHELKTKPFVFEMIPPYGILGPGERLNVQVKFAPREERSYRHYMILSIAQSTQQLVLTVSGQGLEPRLEFNPSIVELGPLLPYASGDEAEVVVKNPCSFPIEFYSLEFDQQYLLEERILRMLKGYDAHRVLLLPPRIPGDKLPPEVLEFYEEQKKILGDQEATNVETVDEDVAPLSEPGMRPQPSSTGQTVSTVGSLLHSLSVHEDNRSFRMEFKLDQEEEEEEEGTDKGQAQAGSQLSLVAKHKEAVGELDNNPVSKAIARHLGIDISPEGRAARNRRGIAIIIHGAPLTGKTGAAVTMAKHYNAACLSIDAIVMEAISDRSSLAGLRARELCIRAAIEQAQRENEEGGGGEGQPGPSLGSRLSGEALAKHPSDGSQHSSESKTGPLSNLSRGYRGSTVTTKGKPESHGSQKPEKPPLPPSQHPQSDQYGSQVPSSPIPCGPVQRRLSLSASVTGDYGLMSCVLPEELLVEILSERMQLNDCYRGMVFDGLETIFARSMTSALLCVLKAINNRRYIYFVNLIQDFAAMKAKEKSKQEQEEREQQEAIAREKARLQDMDEEEYDALTEEQKIHFDSELLQALRERKKREQERMARELEEKKHQQELERLREEEELRKKSKRYKREVAKEKEEAAAAAAASKKGQQAGKPNATVPSLKSDGKLNEGVERKSSTKDRAEMGLNDKDEKKKKGKPTGPNEQPALAQEEEEPEKELMSESERALAQRFKLYEEAQKELLQTLMFWDRVQLVQLQPPGSEEKADEAEDQRQAPSGRKGRKDRERERQERLEKERAEKERQERERLERERLEKLKAMEDRAFGQEGEGEGIDIGVPYLEIQVLSSEEASGKRILESGKLPDVVQVLNGLGLGPSGPPIPPTAFFSVIPFPEKRPVLVTGEALKHFTFLTSEDANAEEDKKDTEASSEATSSLPAAKEEQVTPTRGRAKKEKPEPPPPRENPKDKKGAARGRKGAQASPGTITTPTEVDQGNLTAELSSEKLTRGFSPCRLNHYRWIVPANGEVTMRLHFASNTTGLFDQVLNFEIVGTRRQYQLYCRGTCTYPIISTDPTVVFPHRKKTMKPDEMVFKKFVMSTNVFHFGPLLCGKSREKYKVSRYPNHFERITILNISPLEAEVHFFFQYDSRAITYLLDPCSLTLKPNEKQLLTVWAYPTASGIFEDNIVCCIKDNPEPITFRISCQGVRPELELDRRQLHFEKVLLHRKETKSLYLKNATPLPVAWRISGLENIGDDFSLSDDTGVIGPFSEYCLLVNFKASKVLNIKKAIRLEVSDAENILGIVQIENIQIVAEAYDVALDISFPKGTNGGVELGIVRISDEAKQILSLKNKGKYEIGFSFMVEATDHSMPNLGSLFSIQPQKGNLSPTDRPTQVQIVFHAKREVKIDDKPVLQCQVIEPNFVEGGETIATIPIRLSVHAAFSKYSITPPSLINFGPLMINSRKSSSFTIENKGTLDFKFIIFKQIRDIAIPLRKGNSNIKTSRSREADLSRQNVPQSLGRQSKRAESLQRDINLVAQARFSLGMFTVYPGFGTILPGGHQAITVDCFADQVGKSEEYLIVEITDRDPEDNPAGILYMLSAESCIPGFVTDDAKIIFEEHRICTRSSLDQVLKMVGCEGVFVKDENKFLFTNVLVGHQASARFKIFNNGRIPCDVILATKPISAKSPVRISDVFEIHPVRMCIPSRSHAFATLTFSPQTMQSYHCIFEASIDAPPSVSSKSKHLHFEVVGDGNLPQVTVVRPVLRNKKGAPLLLFRRLLLGHTETLPLLIKNSGSTLVQLYLDVTDEHSAFRLKPTPATQCTYVDFKSEKDGPNEGGKGHETTMAEAIGKVGECRRGGTSHVALVQTRLPQEQTRKPHTASLLLPVGESAEFEVVFHPSLTQRLEGQIRLSILDNQYEETRIQMVGEGYQEDVTLDNIRSLAADGEAGSVEAQLEESTAETARLDHIWFGDCHVGKPYQAAFTITNHSKTDAMRFEWPALNPHLTFSPQVGHLHAGCSKNTILTFKAKAPVSINDQLLKCKVSRIAFPQPADQVPDWDDRQQTVKWVDVSKAGTNPRPSKKKVIEKDPEPAYLSLEEGGRELDLRVSAVVDYAQYKMEVDSVHFKDTLLFQTRVFQVELFNTGNVQLEYTWKVVVEESARMVNFATEPGLTNTEDAMSATSATSIKTQCSRPSSQLGSMLESFSSYLFPTPTRPPFLLEPRSGIIPHGRSQILQVKFSPQEVGEFEGHLFCSIVNLKENEGGPVVTVKGKGLLPYCHFDLEDSDYITANRRNPELRGPGGAGLDPNTKVIEFTSVGIHVRNTKSFVIMNPTNTPYSFHWTCQQKPEESKEHPVFICFTDRGQLRPEKTMEVIFEFIPRHVDITESFWSFSIPELDIVVPFLLVGHTTDPAVYLDRSHLNFHSLLVGHEARESVDIINNEKDTYSFSFRDGSRFSEGRINSLKVQPMEGSILPSTRVPITIFFTPTLEGEVNFNLICDVKRKSQPLCLNVKATGHAMSVSVKHQRSDGSMMELDADQANPLPFHEMQVNDFTQCNFYILNTGKFNFSFSWEFCHAKAVQRYFAIAPETAVVEVGERMEVVLSFHPLKTCSLKDAELKLHISHGPTFTCALQGVVVAPSVHFSFTKVDFGNCFIYHAGMPILKRTLIITNKDKKEASLNCLFANTAHLELGSCPEVLTPGGKAEIPIHFYPREAVSYHEVVTFEINGLLQRTVEVSGKGIEMKIDVVEPRSKVLKFGAVPPGHTAKKTATIVNHSVVFVNFQLNFVSSVPELHEEKVLTMSPSGEISLKPKGGTCQVEVTFAPRTRLLPFTEEVLFECHGVLRTLFAIQGCSHGIQVSLDQDHVPFGAVVLRSQASRRIVMQNTGDLGVGFKWEAKRFKPDFSIRPLEGYISPGMDVSFEVTFHPCEHSPDICYENLPCHIQGGEPLRLTLSGCCVGVPPVKEVVHFICQVRGKHTQTIMLSNKTNQPWTLHPIIEGEQWKGPEFIRVEAHQQNKPYEITYRPLAMNAENKKDQGSIFFPLPDGTGLLYNLQGTTEPPKSAGNIMREVPCKTSYTELLPVSNWLSKPQRFRVTVDMLKPERLEVTTTLKTLDYLEVPASAKKDHKLTFFSYREGMFSAKVTFRNESTQEFLFYLVTFKATPCGPLGTIELTTPVRQLVSSSLKVENPLGSPVTFNTDCKVPDINMPSQFTVPAQSEGVLAFDFQPMRPGESGGRLALNSTDLGSFQYDLVLKATPPRAEKTLHFNTMLGSSQNVVAKFVNYTRQKTEYSAKIDCPDFHVEKVVSAPAGSQGGSEVGVEVTFEPCQLGESRGTLVLSSAAGGDYVIPLCGTCVPPKPQGPIQIKAGTTTTIPFKNVFLQSMSFTYLVENPAFTIKATETIRSKKSASISVSFEGNPSSTKAPVTSKLVVSCPRAAGLGAGVSWVYYLKGIVPEK
ncbi:hydrocephalus-inducing protein homolog [Anolis sagrei]|uniref:hydrocephalus-inducing protein homolog n=1 Tax=Anolis sagrei TaxID=38937 RepID=UPI003520660E